MLRLIYNVYFSLVDRCNYSGSKFYQNLSSFQLVSISENFRHVLSPVHSTVSTTMSLKGSKRNCVSTCTGHFYRYPQWFCE